jgi:hypothetical protein
MWAEISHMQTANFGEKVFSMKDSTVENGLITTTNMFKELA